jgi:hypothetical protein
VEQGGEHIHRSEQRSSRVEGQARLGQIFFSEALNKASGLDVDFSGQSGECQDYLKAFRIQPERKSIKMPYINSTFCSGSEIPDKYFFPMIANECSAKRRINPMVMDIVFFILKNLFILFLLECVAGELKINIKRPECCGDSIREGLENR